MPIVGIRIIVFFAVIYAAFAFAGEGKKIPGNGKKAENVSTKNVLDSHSLININNLSGWIHGNGQLDYNDLAFDNGLIFPRATAGTVFFSGLIWGAFFQDTDPDLRVGGQTYLAGTLPGWITTNGSPGSPPIAVDPEDARARVYRIREDWAGLTVDDPDMIQDAAEFFNVDPGNLTTAQIQQVIDQYATDWAEWPGDLGAPYYDFNANGTWEPGIDEPGLQDADQVAWFVINDADEATTMGLYGSEPLGLETQITIWGYDAGEFLGDCTFRRYRLLNKSGHTLDSMYIALWADTDIGSFFNDLAGCDPALGLGYAYNGEANDFQYDDFFLPPPAFGYSLLFGPLIPSPGDTAIFNFQEVPGYRNLALTSFSYLSPLSVFADPPFDYDGTLAWYNLLRGYLPEFDIDNPSPYIHGAGPETGQPTKFPLDGDPLSQNGDVDDTGNNLSPGDRKIVLACGPFDMAPDEVQEVVFLAAGGIGDDYLGGIQELKETVSYVRSITLEDPAPPPVSHTVTPQNPTNVELALQADLSGFSGISACTAAFTADEGDAEPFTITLFDDGQHGDGLPGDQLWGGTIQLENRKYPHSGTLSFKSSQGFFSFTDVFSSLPVRPVPDLLNWHVSWENGLQDSVISHDELVYMGFTVRNNDAIHAIDSLQFVNLQPEANGQEATAEGVIQPGGILEEDNLHLMLQAPVSGTSVTLSYQIHFDHNIVDMVDTFNVESWIPPASWGDTLGVVPIAGVGVNLFPLIADPSAFEYVDYLVSFDLGADSSSLVWNLTDYTNGITLLENQGIHEDPNYAHPVVDGIVWVLINPGTEPDFTAFETTANAAGELFPPEGAAADFAGFPSEQPTDRQQIGDGIWLIHTGDNGSRNSYEDFIQRTTRDGSQWGRILGSDYEMRFTSSGSYAIDWFTTGNVFHVPFELWNIGADTPNDPSDDYRMTIVLIDWDEDLTFNLSEDDHTVSSGSDDPHTDWFYWFRPENTTPGEDGYFAEERQMLQGVWEHDGTKEIMARNVLVNWDGGSEPPYNQDLPEEGTVFRIKTIKPNFPGDSLLVSTVLTGTETPPVPADFYLQQNYPNPFNPSTTIRFGLDRNQLVKLIIYNILGQKVAQLVDTRLSMGHHEVIWNGRNDAGNRVSSGVFFYRLQAGEQTLVRKMMLLK